MQHAIIFSLKALLLGHQCAVADVKPPSATVISICLEPACFWHGIAGSLPEL